jgi:hypothetical protein
MKAIKSVDVKSFVLYGAIVAAFWTIVIGIYYWVLGWIFGATTWWIDVNLGNWTTYTLTAFARVFVRALFAAAGGALAGWVIALVYNFAAGTMGGLKIDLAES